ncbi:MAG: DUF4157 domain-containing protein [Nostoc sp. ChiSLP02]|nr:DUF4157 domain-containing protein [Nostoc sp. DedSLP05]MDZ8098719.1 DUF4157 domain-containing protein [Nostoc sp. DedSLP01]MDZ8183668.1 DUF4157 domain-containing protein [Nostoc sp. ChiSLP02]
MANVGKQQVSSKQLANIGQKKSIFEPAKFPQLGQNVTAPTATTDLSDYRQPQPGEAIANVMNNLLTSNSLSPPNHITKGQLQAPKRHEREPNIASVTQLKAPPRISSPQSEVVQKQEAGSPNQTGLPDALKTGVENLSGYSLDGVKVHYNSPKPAQLQALAYTQGTEIHVAPGQEKHLPHEAWHVVQQMQGRVKPTMQMRGNALNADSVLEREADVMGVKASQNQTAKSVEVHNNSSSLSKTVIQPRLGFEIEMLVLVDINGRPIPEKVDLGTAGVHNVEMTVDHGPAVAAATPTPARLANFSIPGMGPALIGGGRGPLDLRAYDTPVGTETKLDFPGGVVGVDPRAGAAVNLLNWANWSNATVGIDRTRTRNPDNRPIVQIDNILQNYNYQTLYDNYETTDAQLVLLGVKTQIDRWQALNPNANTRFGHLFSNTDRTTRYNAAHVQINALDAEVLAQQTMWRNNPAAPGGMVRHYRQPGGLGVINPWNAAHPRFQPQEGMGKDRYASILEIVTPGGAGFEPETLAGRANIIGAMTDAVNLAIAIETATHNFADRVLLSGVTGVNNVTNPQIHVGNPQQPNQTTNASIQSTMAIDLAQIASFFKSTVGTLSPQNLFELKHASDPVSQHIPRRAKTEIARAPRVAQNIIRNRMASVAGWDGNVTHLRGLITLICQYLMMGKYSLYQGEWGLDKNIVPLLSRNDLGAVIFNELVPPAEQTLVATRQLRRPLIAAILAETGREGDMAVFNKEDDDIPPFLPAPFDVSCRQFIINVLKGQPDGITGHLGGFRQFRHPEGVDPTGARAGDYHRHAATQREGAIFELRNMIPSELLINTLNLTTDRFPHNQWVAIATYMSNLLAALNARTVADSARDTRYYQNTRRLQNELANW